MATLLGKTPHSPCPIPTTSTHPSQKLNDVVAVLFDPHFFVSDAQHELRRRSLKTSGPKTALLQRLFDALEAEYARGWTLGYLLNTKLLPFDGKGFDPRRLAGHHVKGYSWNRDGVMTLELSDGEDVTILADKSFDECVEIKMDHDLFWALHTLDGLKAVPRCLVDHPLLITEAATGVRKDRWGKEAGTVFGVRLEGMRAISFFFLAGKSSSREDRVCGDVRLAENRILCQDMRVLHGCDEMVVEDVGKWPMMDNETAEDMRVLHGSEMCVWGELDVHPRRF